MYPICGGVDKQLFSVEQWMSRANGIGSNELVARAAQLDKS